jgi:hypothetical protein
MIIKLCKKYSKKNKFAKKLALNFADAEIQIKSCIGMCKSCKSEPSANVNGKNIKKKNIKKFINAIAG